MSGVANSMFNVFMGHYDIVLEEILNHVNIDLAIVENKDSNREVVHLCERNGIPFRIIKNYGEMVSCMSEVPLINLCFVASFGIILKDDFIRRCNHIINFHPGDVAICRGRHPLPTAILNHHETMGITVHFIDSEAIDAGPIIAKMMIPIAYNESYKYNESRLLAALRYIARYVVEDYARNGRFTSYDWRATGSDYYPPLEKDILDKIVHSKCLRELGDQ